jgi:hypothetical protein
MVRNASYKKMYTSRYTIGILEEVNYKISSLLNKVPKISGIIFTRLFSILSALDRI